MEIHYYPSLINWLCSDNYYITITQLLSNSIKHIHSPISLYLNPLHLLPILCTYYSNLMRWYFLWFLYSWRSWEARTGRWSPVFRYAIEFSGNLKVLMPTLYYCLLADKYVTCSPNYVPVCMSVIRSYLYMLLFTLKNAHLLSSDIELSWFLPHVLHVAGSWTPAVDNEGIHSYICMNDFL